jgi:hypothetical protein
VTPRSPEELQALIEDQAIDEVLSAQEDAGRPPPVFQWRLKNVVDSIEMPGLQESNGVPVKLHNLQVKSNLMDIVADLLEQFQTQGLYMRDFRDQEQQLAQTQVTAYDPYRQISYTALIECRKSSPCTVILGEANIGLGLANEKAHAAKEDFAPLPPNATSVQRSRTENYESIVFSTPASPAATRKFYNEELPRQGYTKKEGVDMWRRPGDAIQLVLKAMDDGKHVVMLTHSKGSLESGD